MAKEKVLNIRLSFAEYELIQSAAKEKLITPSALVRSLAITAINNKFEPLMKSPTPNFDLLSFEFRKDFLHLYESMAAILIKAGGSISQIESSLADCRKAMVLMGNCYIQEIHKSLANTPS